ncbi:cytochrome P450 [Nocardia sp. NPDC059239]|uniref:cytochrome P450 n=1 Tax=Nocardia sp. NPDC059239 TaxID=3346785 RepID=UPI0036A3B89D
MNPGDGERQPRTLSYEDGDVVYLPELTYEDRVRLSKEKPICRLRYPDGHYGWLVTSPTLARSVYADSRFRMRPLQLAVDDGGLGDALSGPELAGEPVRNDPPQHTRLRRALAPHFTPRRVSEYREVIDRTVRERLDAMQDSGSPAEVVTTFAVPVSSATIGALLGLPMSERANWEDPSAVLFEPGTGIEMKKAALRQLYSYLDGVISRKRESGGPDVLTKLIAAEEFSEVELTGIAYALVTAGFYTWVEALASGVRWLLEDRERWELMKANAEAIDRAVEELLRSAPARRGRRSDVRLARTATEDIELEGVVVKAGEAVTVAPVLPHGDPSRDPDLEHFDPSRDVVGHLQFGHGIHMCLGQHLARLELQIALQQLMERFPTLYLADDSGARIDDSTLNGRRDHLEDPVLAPLLVGWY